MSVLVAGGRAASTWGARGGVWGAAGGWRVEDWRPRGSQRRWADVTNLSTVCQECASAFNFSCFTCLGLDFPPHLTFSSNFTAVSSLKLSASPDCAKRNNLGGTFKGRRPSLDASISSGT